MGKERFQNSLRRQLRNHVIGCQTFERPAINSHLRSSEAAERYC